MDTPKQGNSLHNIPLQTISYAEKMKNECQWGKDSMEAYINLAAFSNSSYKVYLKKLYDFYNGHIDEGDYKNVLQPYGKQRLNSLNEIRNFPIIKPKVDLLRGEFAKRPDNYTVTITNSDVITKYTEELNQQINSSLETIFTNQLNQNQLPTGVPSEETKPPAYIAEEFESKYRDKRAIIGQNALSYIKKYNHIEEQYDIAFLDWMTTGEVYSYTSVNYNEPVHEIVNPLDIDYDKDPDLMFIEDGDWVVRRKYMHPSSVVERFYDVLTEDETKELEQSTHSGSQWFLPFTYVQDRTQPFKAYGRLVEVIHVTWRSRKKIGILHYTDEIGQPQKMEVDELYTPTPDQEVEWFWVEEVWEGYRIDGKYYKKIQPLEIQRNSLDNLSECKLPYNGRIMSNRNTKNISLVALGVPFQIFYNAVHYRLDLAVAKMRDSMAMLDVNVIPKGWDIDKFLYYVDMTGIGFVDYNKEGVKFNPQHQTMLKVASETIKSYIELLEFIRKEWDEVCGITRQREGDISTSETVGGVERAVVQSSLITEMYFRLFDQFKERNYQALLDYSKIAWINGKKTSFVQPETGKLIYMDVNGDQYSEAEFGIFVSNSQKELQKLQQIQSLAQAMMQNGTRGSTVAEILDHESFAQIKDALRKAEAKADEMNQMMEQQKAENEKSIMEKQKELEAIKHQYTLEEIDRKGEWDLRGKELTAYGLDEGPNTEDIHEAAALALEERKHNDTMALKKTEIEANQYNDDKRMAHEREMKQQDMKMKKEELEAKKAIEAKKAKARPKSK